jgi:hypothetical protein
VPGSSLNSFTQSRCDNPPIGCHRSRCNRLAVTARSELPDRRK